MRLNIQWWRKNKINIPSKGMFKRGKTEKASLRAYTTSSWRERASLKTQIVDSWRAQQGYVCIQRC